MLFASVAFNLGAYFVKKNAASLKFIVDQDLRLEAGFLYHDVFSHVYNQHPLLRFDPSAVTFADMVPGLQFGLADFSQCRIYRLKSLEAKQPGRTPRGQLPKAPHRMTTNFPGPWTPIFRCSTVACARHENARLLPLLYDGTRLPCSCLALAMCCCYAWGLCCPPLVQRRFTSTSSSSRIFGTPIT